MEIPEEDRHGDEADIARIPQQMWKQLNRLRKHKVRKKYRPEYRYGTLSSFTTSLVHAVCCVITGLGQREVEGHEEEDIEQQSPLRDGGLEDGIHGPRVVPVACKVSVC